MKSTALNRLAFVFLSIALLEFIHFDRAEAMIIVIDTPETQMDRAVNFSGTKIGVTEEHKVRVST